MSDDNEERQENELLALESIYGERQYVTAAGGDGGGKLAAYIELPENFKVAYPSARTDKEQSIPNEEELSFEEISIQFLPPVILNFELPENYPSDAPPSFTLTCKWLTVMQLAKLCKQLDTIWNDQGPGCEVLFEWMQFLSDQLLSFLEVSSSLLLSCISSRNSPDKRSSGYDTRASQDVASIEDLVNFLIAYDSQESIRRFNTQYYNCGICCMEKLGLHCVKFPKCQHVYCSECIANYFVIQIRDGLVRSLHCPEDKCESQAEPNMVKKLVSNEIYEQYENYLLQSTLDCMDDTTYCPRSTCQNVVFVDLESETLGCCPACKFVFCVFCKRTYHGVSSCPINNKELLSLREEYLNGNKETKVRLEKMYGKKKLQNVVEEMYTEAWMKKYSQRCPSCRTNIEKIDGCNKMHCLKCNNYFCWLCRQKLERTNPYGHFNDLKSKCFNKLFVGIIDGEYGFSDDEDEWY